jgi:hypothetical protein
LIKGIVRWTGSIVGTVRDAVPELDDGPLNSPKADVFTIGLLPNQLLVARPGFLPTYAPDQMMHTSIDSLRVS